MKSNSPDEAPKGSYTGCAGWAGITAAATGAAVGGKDTFSVKELRSENEFRSAGGRENGSAADASNGSNEALAGGGLIGLSEKDALRACSVPKEALLDGCGSEKRS